MCPNVPKEILNPVNTWSDKDKYTEKAKELAKSFNENFIRFEEYATEEMKQGIPKNI